MPAIRLVLLTDRSDLKSALQREACFSVELFTEPTATMRALNAAADLHNLVLLLDCDYLKTTANDLLRRLRAGGPLLDLKVLLLTRNPGHPGFRKMADDFDACLHPACVAARPLAATLHELLGQPELPSFARA